MILSTEREIFHVPSLCQLWCPHSCLQTTTDFDSVFQHFSSFVTQTKMKMSIFIQWKCEVFSPSLMENVSGVPADIFNDNVCSFWKPSSFANPCAMQWQMFQQRAVHVSLLLFHPQQWLSLHNNNGCTWSQIPTKATPNSNTESQGLLVLFAKRERRGLSRNAKSWRLWNGPSAQQQILLIIHIPTSLTNNA